MPQSIKPVSGFPEYLPGEQIVFNRMISIIRSNFELYGFTPIETPAVERKQTLIAKGGDEKEIYALERLHAAKGEDSSTEMALHFDLTVPLARYVSMHQNELTFPFKRYQIQKIWRGERPQAGRYREFYQCDIDVIGREKLALENDAEMPAVIYKIFREMEIGAFTISINNRKFISGYLMSLGIKEGDIPKVLHIIDKRDKVGKEKMTADLSAFVSEDEAQTLCAFLVPQDDPFKALEYFATHGHEINESLGEGAREILATLDNIKAHGVPDEFITVDLGIVRGLDYYTGTVYETQLTEYPEIGSVCSGGRYENLAGAFSNTALPGVGISIGLSRIMTYLFEQGAFDVSQSSPSHVLVTSMDEAYSEDYKSITALLRNTFIPAEMYTEGGKIDKQLKYAHGKGIRYVIIMGEDEKKEEVVLIKDLQSGEQEKVKITDIIAYFLDKK